MTSPQPGAVRSADHGGGVVVEAVQHQQTGAGQLLAEEIDAEVPVVFAGDGVEIVDQPGGRICLGGVVAGRPESRGWRAPGWSPGEPGERCTASSGSSR